MRVYVGCLWHEQLVPGVMGAKWLGITHTNIHTHIGLLHIVHGIIVVVFYCCCCYCTDQSQDIGRRRLLNATTGMCLHVRHIQACMCVCCYECRCVCVCVYECSCICSHIKVYFLSYCFPLLLSYVEHESPSKALCIWISIYCCCCSLLLCRRAHDYAAKSVSAGRS